MEPDTHKKCRVFETGNQGCEKVFITWGRRGRCHFKQQCNGTSGYSLWFLITQTTLQVRLWGFGDTLCRAAGVRGVLKRAVRYCQSLKSEFCLWAVQLFGNTL